MSSKTNNTSDSRRNILKALGAASAATFAAPIISGASGSVLTAGQATGKGSLKLTLLLPKDVPAVKGLRQGFELYIGTVRTASVKVQSTGLGITNLRSAIQSAAQKSDVVVCLMNPGATRSVRDIPEHAGKVFVEMSAGERLTSYRDPSPFVFRNSLDLARGSAAAAFWAVREIGSRCVVASSYHDSGFDGITAFHHAFLSAGGKVLQEHVTDAPMSGISIQTVLDQAGKSGADFVFASYSGKDAVAFAKAWQASGLSSRMQLVTTGMMGPIAGAHSVLGWADGLSTPEYTEFVDRYTARYGSTPDAYAALGYDTARMICEASKTGGDLRSGLRSVAFKGACGHMAMNPYTNTISSPLYIRRGNGNSAIALSDLQYNDSTLPATERGWLSVYGTQST